MADNPGFAIYIHWPFCQSKCPYCDFNSHVRTQIDEQAFADALVRELENTAALIPARPVHSIFFGGGTPSLMSASTVARLIETVARLFPLEADCEITLEANPTSVEADRFAGFSAAGVNRISCGVQSLDDVELRRLGRTHSAADALRALDIARGQFDRVSLDLIYARPNQSLASWEGELTRALALGTDHLSLYQLTIEPGTRFADLHARGRLVIPGDDHAAELYALTQTMTEAVGLPAYEVSNHARPGSECRHNLVYWRYGQYAGIGPGAHGRVMIEGQLTATQTEKNPERWLAAVERSGLGHSEQTPISAREQGEEMLMMGLRLAEGVSRKRFAALTGRDLTTVRLDQLAQDNLIAYSGDTIRATPSGNLVLNALLSELLA